MNISIHNNQTFLNGDVIACLNKIQDNSIDLIFIDPPYNIGKQYGKFKDSWPDLDSYLEWSYSYLEIAIRKLKPNGSLYFMCATQYMPHFDIYLSKKLTILSRIIWHYDSSSVQAKNKFGSMYEPILHCVKDANNYTFNGKDILVETASAKRNLIDYRKNPPMPYNSHKVPGNVWYYPRVRFKMKEYTNHPTQKPIALLERIIKASSNVNDIVLDIFAGSHTTAFVCNSLDRKCISIEMNFDYVKIGINRILQ